MGTLVVVALFAFGVYLLLGVSEGDPDHYGEVPIPGSATVELPDGEIDVFYAEGLDPSSDVTLSAPDDLEYSIAAEDGESIRIDPREGSRRTPTRG